MIGDFYARAARDLPNFPPEVMRRWFWHAESAGWPPQRNVADFPVGTWGNVLGRLRPFSFWHTVTWTLESLPLRIGALEPETGDIVNQLGIAFAQGLPHPLDIPIRDASVRIGEFVAELQTTRRLSHPPILLRVGPRFEVLDGNHRLAALFVAQANGVPLEPLHEAWVATAGTS